MIKMALIDDEQSVLEWLETSLPWEQCGVNLVGTAENGKQGLDIIQKELPDIVITSIDMPIMDGLEMMEKAVGMGIDTKFIVLSGYNEFENAQEAIRYGVKEYLPKPVTEEQIMEAVKRVSCRIEESKRRMEWVKEMCQEPHLNQDKLTIQLFQQLIMQIPVQDEVIQDYRKLTGHGERTKYQVILIRIEGQAAVSDSVVRMIEACFRKYHFEAVTVNYLPGEIMLVISYLADNLLYIILNENMKKVTKMVSDRLEEEFHLSCTIGISEIQKGLESVYGCANQSKNALVFTTLEENHNIVSISNLMFEDEEYHSPIKRERQLLNALKSGDADEAEHVLDMIYEEFCEQKKNSLSINKKICTELIVVCIKGIYPLGLCLNELFQTEDDPIYLIHDQKSITDVKKIVYRAVRQMAECIGDKKCAVPENESGNK